MGTTPTVCSNKCTVLQPSCRNPCLERLQEEDFRLYCDLSEKKGEQNMQYLELGIITQMSLHPKSYPLPFLQKKRMDKGIRKKLRTDIIDFFF